MPDDETQTLSRDTEPRTAADSPSPGKRQAGWTIKLVMVGIVLAALNLRPAITSLGPLLEEVQHSLGMSDSVAGLLTSVPSLCFAVFGILAPRLARRYGPGAIVCAGMVAIAAGLLIRPFAGGTVGFLAASALALMGIAVSNVLMPVIVKRYFPDRVGSMTGLYSMALAAGTSLAAAVTVPLTHSLGDNWHWGLGIWAILAVVAVVPWIALVRDRSAAAPRRPPPPRRSRLRRRSSVSPAPVPPGRSPASSDSRPPPRTSPWAGCRRSSATPGSRPPRPGCCSP